MFHMKNSLAYCAVNFSEQRTIIVKRSRIMGRWGFVPFQIKSDWLGQDLNFGTDRKIQLH